MNGGGGARRRRDSHADEKEEEKEGVKYGPDFSLARARPRSPGPIYAARKRSDTAAVGNE